MSSDLPRVGINADQYVDITSKQEANDFALATVGLISSGCGKILVGLNCKWNYKDGTSSHVTQILQLSFLGCPVAVFHLVAMDATSPASFPTELKKLLKLPNLVAVAGQQIVGDVSRLEKLGVTMIHLIELGELAKRHDPDQPEGT